MPEEYVTINGRRYRKPTKGRCAYCGSDMLEFYDDGSGICLNCGRTFSWLKPLKEPVVPGIKKDAPVTAGPQTVERAPVPASKPDFPEDVPDTRGLLSPRTISILGLAAAILLSLGAMIIIAALPTGSWPTEEVERNTLENINKAGMLVWSLGTMLFLMAGFASAGTEEMDAGVRRALIVSSVVLAILSFSLWMGLRMMGGL